MNFVLIGAAGYIAPKHMRAIKEVGGNLVAIYDPHDAVGVIDQHFPRCKYFKDFERLDRFCESTQVDYVSICSPNYMHDAHCRFALRIGAEAICEKPVTCTVRNFDTICGDQEKYGLPVWPLLQMRIHPKILEFRAGMDPAHRYAVNVHYATPRGDWYDWSWKGKVAESGGVATNIGVHLIDLCAWLFGKARFVQAQGDNRTVEGKIAFERADVTFFLSTSCEHAPSRIITIDGSNINISEGFTEAHTEVYRKIIGGESTRLEEAREGIAICEAIRNRLNRQ